MKLFKKLSWDKAIKLSSGLKTLVIMILLVGLSGSLVFNYFVQKEANRDFSLYVEVKESLGEIEENLGEKEEKYLGLVEDYIGLVEETNIIKGERTGDWVYMQCTAYTSLDEGVDEVSSIGMNIAKWNMYMNFCAVVIDNVYEIEYGDVLLVEMPSGIIEAFIVADTGDLNIDQIDLYFGMETEDAFEFGKRNLRVWIIKS